MSSLAKYAGNLTRKYAAKTAEVGGGVGLYAAMGVSDPIDLVILGTSDAIGLIPVVGNAIFALQMLGMGLDMALGSPLSNMTNKELMAIEDNVYTVINKTLSADSQTKTVNIKTLEAIPIIFKPDNEKDTEKYYKYIMEYLDNNNLMLASEAQAVQDAEDDEVFQDKTETLYKNLLLIKRVKQRKYFKNLLATAREKIKQQQEDKQASNIKAIYAPLLIALITFILIIVILVK